MIYEEMDYGIIKKCFIIDENSNDMPLKEDYDYLVNKYGKYIRNFAFKKFLDENDINFIEWHYDLYINKNENCIDCIDCVECVNCSECVECLNCTDCKYCKESTYLSKCDDCINCHSCVNCSNLKFSMECTKTYDSEYCIYCLESFKLVHCTFVNYSTDCVQCANLKNVDKKYNMYNKD